MYIHTYVCVSVCMHSTYIFLKSQDQYLGPWCLNYRTKYILEGDVEYNKNKIRTRCKYFFCSFSSANPGSIKVLKIITNKILFLGQFPEIF